MGQSNVLQLQQERIQQQKALFADCEDDKEYVAKSKKKLRDALELAEMNHKLVGETIDDYDIKDRHYAEGAEGKVMIVTLKADPKNTIKAIKVREFKLSKTDAANGAFQEITFMLKFSTQENIDNACDRHICNLEKVFFEKLPDSDGIPVCSVNIVMPFYNYSFRSWLFGVPVKECDVEWRYVEIKNEGKKDEKHISNIKRSFKEVKSMLKKVLEGLNEIQAKSTVHKDVKPENILLREIEPLKYSVSETDKQDKNPTANWECVISDFGCSKDVNNMATTDSGTAKYQPPEVREPASPTQKRSSTKRDMYAFGVILYEIFVMDKNETLSRNAACLINQEDIEKRIKLIFPADEIDKIMIKDLEIILKWTLQSKPINRPHAANLLHDSHPFFDENSTIPTIPFNIIDILPQSPPEHPVVYELSPIKQLGKMKDLDGDTLFKIGLKYLFGYKPLKIEENYQFAYFYFHAAAALRDSNFAKVFLGFMLRLGLFELDVIKGRRMMKDYGDIIWNYLNKRIEELSYMKKDPTEEERFELSCYLFCSGFLRGATINFTKASLFFRDNALAKIFVGIGIQIWSINVNTTIATFTDAYKLGNNLSLVLLWKKLKLTTENMVYSICPYPEDAPEQFIPPPPNVTACYGTYNWKIRQQTIKHLNEMMQNPDDEVMVKAKKACEEFEKNGNQLYDEKTVEEFKNVMQLGGVFLTSEAVKESQDVEGGWSELCLEGKL